MRAATHLVVIAGSAAASFAQPFVHNIAEPLQARETANDLTILANREIASVGSIGFDTANIMMHGYLLVTDPEGDAITSWIIREPDAERAPLIAAREDPVDEQLIVLLDSAVTPNPIDNDLVLFKVDPFTGALGYQIRYDDVAHGRNLGMELDGLTGLVAASVVSTNGASEASLLRFRNASGLPVFHFRYQMFNAPAFDARFFDVAVSPDSGDIFAVGSVLVDSPLFTPERKLLIARFTAAGLPVWFRAYEVRVGSDDAGPAEGASIEMSDAGRVAVTVRVTDQNAGLLSAHLIVSAAAGAPLNASALVNTQGSIDPAFSSLERRADGSMLVSGTSINAAGVPSPTVWTFDAASTALGWVWAPEVEDGVGNSAIPQTGRGPLLGGLVFPVVGPIGGLRDVFLARTQADGIGLCPKKPLLRELPVSLGLLDIPVKAIPLPPPDQAGLLAEQGDPVRRFVCVRCPADLAPPFGVLNFFDLAAYIALYNAMDPAADLAPPFGVFNFFDIAEYINLYNMGCP